MKGRGGGRGGEWTNIKLAFLPKSEVITDLKHTLNEMMYEVQQDMECKLLTDTVKKHLDMVELHHQGV